jgi:hypothetical protein
MPRRIMFAAAVALTGALLLAPRPAPGAPGFWLELNPPCAPFYPRLELDVSSVQ